MHTEVISPRQLLGSKAMSTGNFMIAVSDSVNLILQLWGSQEEVGFGFKKEHFDKTLYSLMINIQFMIVFLSSS